MHARGGGGEQIDQERPDAFRTDGSAITTSADVYEVRLTNTSTGQRVKCTVDQNGIVTDLIELR